MTTENCRLLLVSNDPDLSGRLRRDAHERGYNLSVKSFSDWQVQEDSANSCGSELRRACTILDGRREHGIDVNRLTKLGVVADAVMVCEGAVDDAVAAARAGTAVILEARNGHDLVERLRAIPAQLARTVEAPAPDHAARILGNTDAMQRVREHVRRIAQYPDVSVLISGETGTGKELVAEALHALSRCEGAFVPVNCAAIPEGLFEAEFFGHEAGAFTGARGSRSGYVEQAARGTLFLDEIGELDQGAQAKLLRLLEARQYRRVASAQLAAFTGRFVTATHRALGALGPGETGNLRPDVYYRLAAFVIMMPPLRERRADIELLATHFLGEFCRRYRRPALGITPEALTRLEQHDWPGNVRELRAVVERAAIVCSHTSIHELDLARAMGQDGSQRAERISGTQLRDVERNMILHAFDNAHGNISLAAARLGIPRTTLRDKLRRYATGGT